MATPSAPHKPVTDAQLESIASEACNSVLGLVSTYLHTQTEAWNTSIIHKILESLVATAQTSSPSQPKTQYKYIVNSTIIQHLSELNNTAVSTGAGSTENEISSSTASEPKQANPASDASAVDAASITPAKGRRGMHSATGAYWNNDADGMWNYKWQGGEERGMDVVVCVIWIVV